MTRPALTLLVNINYGDISLSIRVYGCISARRCRVPCLINSHCVNVRFGSMCLNLERRRSISCTRNVHGDPWYLLYRACIGLIYVGLSRVQLRGIFIGVNCDNLLFFWWCAWNCCFYVCNLWALKCNKMLSEESGFWVFWMINSSRCFVECKKMDITCVSLVRIINWGL